MVPEKSEHATVLPRTPSDELVGQGLSGDLHAFRSLVEAFEKYAYVLSYRLLGDNDEAKDAVQDAFIRVWHHRGSYRTTIKFTTWIYTIVTNLCYDRLRERKRRGLVPIEAVLLAPSRGCAADEDPERSYSNKETAALVEEASRFLSPRQKTVFILRDMEGLSVREVADVLRISESSVKTNLVYARKFLRSKLQAVLK